MPDLLWIGEAVAYMGLDRLGLDRPDVILRKWVKNGILPEIRLSGRLAFHKEDLDRVARNGDKRRKPGRARKQPALVG